MNTLQPQPAKGFANWLKESVIVKLFLIGMLTLFLLIPSAWIQDLIWERQQRQNEVISEISDKWSGSQLLEGPVLVLPYKTRISEKDSTGRVSFQEVLTNIYILPEDLNIASKANPELLHRGIFDAVVYNTKIQVQGKFSPLELKKSGIDPTMILWDKAKVVIGLSDLKGLKNNPIVRLSDSSYHVEPDFASVKLFSNNLVILPDLSTKKNTALSFNFELDIRGSSELSFMHLGKSTTVKINGKWNNPSFTGRYLPEDRKISEKNFSAFWKMPYFNRPFPQQWVGDDVSLTSAKSQEAVFGVKFILPVDQYQKTMRSAKYAILVILLTFVSLFFTELLKKTKIHLLQYVLIGSAMIIYYTLLLSFTEQVGFMFAYLIASVATIVLVSVFIASLLKNKKIALIFAIILSIFYGFIYTIIQLQDMALLFGSIGLFITVALLMHFSGKINWERGQETAKEPEEISYL